MVGGGPDCNDSKTKLKKGPWTREEDQKLLAYIEEHGHGSWRTLPTKAGTFILLFFWFFLILKRECIIYLFCRVGEVREELQIEMDELSET